MTAWWQRMLGELGWQRQAACRRTEVALWFPGPRPTGRPRADGSRSATVQAAVDAAAEAAAKAKALCAACPVCEECLEYSLANGIRYGTWGGHTQDERREMMRRRRSAA